MSQTLCVVTGCRIRGRHLPGCATNQPCPVNCTCHNGPHYTCDEPGGCGTAGCGRQDDCAGCLPRVAEEGLACDWCVGRAAAQLETVIDVTPAARDIAQRQTSRGGGSGAGKPGSSLPLDLGATARLDAVQNALGTWARHVSEERGVSL